MSFNYFFDRRINDNVPYGQHITLTCKNHPDKKWYTKNIGSIGDRTIFFNGPGEECKCPIMDLIPVNSTRE